MHKVAFIGFRHSHIFILLEMIRQSPDFTIVACCEEDPATRAELAGSDKVTIDHDSYDQLLATDCHIIAIGDYYAKRGGLAIRALEHGKHVISDKPIATS